MVNLQSPSYLIALKRTLFLKLSSLLFLVCHIFLVYLPKRAKSLWLAPPCFECWNTTSRPLPPTHPPSARLLLKMWVPEPAASASLRSLLEMLISLPHTRPNESESALSKNNQVTNLHIKLWEALLYLHEWFQRHDFKLHSHANLKCLSPVLSPQRQSPNSMLDPTSNLPGISNLNAKQESGFFPQVRSLRVILTIFSLFNPWAKVLLMAVPLKYRPSPTTHHFHCYHLSLSHQYFGGQDFWESPKSPYFHQGSLCTQHPLIFPNFLAWLPSANIF